MADLHQIVDLCAAANPGFAHAGTVNAGVGLHLHVVFDHHRRGLRDLVPAPVFVLGESEPVRADHNSVLQQHIIPQLAVLPHHSVGMSKEAIPNL